jgi:hypothetical protein
MIVPPPTYNEPELSPEQEADARQYAWITWFINLPTWKCECGAVMMGRMKYCIWCKNRLGRHTPRPDGYLEPPFLGG